MKLAGERQMSSIAFPSISTGAYAFPIDRASRIAAREIGIYLRNNPVPERIRMVCFDARTYRHYLAAFQSRL
jgi:O-acetyl-ADP-ribose deacetylase (regulator of RNase III)